MQPVAATERAGRLAQLRVDERVDDHSGPALGAAERELQVVDGLDPREADLLEVLVRKPSLERVDEPDCGLAGGDRDHVKPARAAGEALQPARAETTAAPGLRRSRAACSTARGTTGRRVAWAAAGRSRASIWMARSEFGYPATTFGVPRSSRR